MVSHSFIQPMSIEPLALPGAGETMANKVSLLCERFNSEVNFYHYRLLGQVNSSVLMSLPTQ